MSITTNAALLLPFLEAGKSRGASDEFLAALLMRRGWPAEDVYAALGNYWETATGLAIPERGGSGESARDAFLYLLSFSTLAMWSGAFGSMLFEFIDHWFPDAVSIGYTYSLRSQVTWQMASIVVSFPIYLLVMRLIFRETASHPERLQSGVRKWLTYIALLATAGAMIGDLIWFLDYFLMGELTVRFVLKAATVMLICGAIFTYYLGFLRWNRHTNVSRERSRSIRFGVVACVAVIAAFGTGMGVAGSPSQQRKIEADRKRVQDLRNIAMAIEGWRRANANAGLPATLAELPQTVSLRRADPLTGKSYPYRRISATNYELCADFYSPNEGGEPYGSGSWNHNAGRACFALDVTRPVAW